MFDNFKEYYLDRIENLKIVMSLMNHTCLRIKVKAMTVLYHFFAEIDLRKEKIQIVLLSNKSNFEKYFTKLLSNEDSDVSEKGNFILYQLERLQNM